MWATINHPFFRCVRRHESDRGGAPLYLGGATAKNPLSSASGHYQFVNGTWQHSWIKLLHRSAPAASARGATSYDQHLLAGVVFIHGGARAWTGTGCGYGT